MNNNKYKNIFINHTNHSSDKWGAEQTEAAKKYGDILDIPFPNIDPHLDTEGVYDVVREHFDLIMDHRPQAVLCQGEFVYVCKMAELLKEAGVKVLAATSERVVTETIDESGNDVKTVIFTFVRFREF